MLSDCFKTLGPCLRKDYVLKLLAPKPSLLRKQEPKLFVPRDCFNNLDQRLRRDDVLRPLARKPSLLRRQEPKSSSAYGAVTVFASTRRLSCGPR